jgi:transcriptional regulator with XRE-family HTH domain/tetratricopeptide (TPR) repeat protein
MQEYARRVKREREQHLWSQEQVAEKIGTTAPNVSRWERGKTFPDTYYRRKLCELFGKSAEELGLIQNDADEKSEQLPNQRVVAQDSNTPVLMASLSPRNQNRQRMLQKVRSFWIIGVLEQSLHGNALITLGLQEQPDAVANPWKLVLHQPDQPAHLLPPGTRITQVYDTTDGELLILGEPGSGKTTLLLELARDLLDRAMQDETLPMPVVFNLSSWIVKRKSLADWLVEELHMKYQVPRKLAREWVDSDQVLPLLDGLDELTPSARTACVEAINTFRQEHGLLPTVVCCRSQEYFTQSARLLLQRAVVVQPLTAQQIEMYLLLAGEKLAALRTAACVFDSAIPLPFSEAKNLVGRETLLQQVKKQLSHSGRVALSALHGLPGVGKTALAVVLAHDVEIREHFRDGILWAGLGPKPDVLGVLSRWGKLLGIASAERAKLSSSEAWAMSIRAAIGLHRMLLVIDDAWDTEEAMAFHVGGPNCAYLLTTRFPLIAASFAVEGAVQVPELSEADGVALLARFAPEAVAHDLGSAYALVYSVGALPLALTLMGKYLQLQSYSRQPRRLAAAMQRLQATKERLCLFEPCAAVDRSPNMPPGVPVSLQAVIAVSDQQLDSLAQGALRALSVFPAKPNTFSEEAALAVCQMPVEVLDALSDAGLLEGACPDRYMIHQAIADYAKMHLTGTAAHERFIAYGVSYAETHTTDYEAVERESSMILAALEASYRGERWVELGRGVCAVAHFLQRRGVYSLAERNLLRTARSLREVLKVTSPLLHLGTIVDQRRDTTQVETCLQEGLSLARQQGDDERIGALLASLGWVASLREDYAQANVFYREGLALARHLGQHERISALLAGLGWVAEKQEDYAQAEAYLQEGLVLARQQEDDERISVLLASLGWVESKRGNVTLAEAYGEAGLVLTRKSGDTDRLCILLICLGHMAIERGDGARAEEYLQEALVLAQKQSNPERLNLVIGFLGWAASVRRDYSKAEALYQEAIISARSLGYRERLCNMLTGIGWVAYEQKNENQAEVYLQEGLALARQLGHRELILRQVTILGRLAEKRKLYTQAETLYNEGLVVARQLGQLQTLERFQILFNTLYRLGELHLKQQQLHMATDTFTEMLNLIPSAGSQEMFAKAQYGLARVSAVQGDIDEAHRLGELSAAIFEGVGHHLGSEVREWLKIVPATTKV